MELRKQLINNIEILPEEAINAVSIIVQQFIILTTKTEKTSHPVYGSGKGKMWIADDFDAPLEELKEYMQ